jgi:hypothetical protein
VLVEERIRFLGYEQRDVLHLYVETLQGRHQGIRARHDSYLTLE